MLQWSMQQRILFVCSMNKLRSPTAEGVFATLGDIEVDSAGTAHDAHNPLTPENVAWATHIVCMEDEHASHVRRRYKAYLKAQVIVLNIPDEYDYMDSALIWKLDKTMARWYKGQEKLNLSLFGDNGPTP